MIGYDGSFRRFDGAYGHTRGSHQMMDNCGNSLQLELWSIALFLQFQLSSIFQILSAGIVIVFAGFTAITHRVILITMTMSNLKCMQVTNTFFRLKNYWSDIELALFWKLEKKQWWFFSVAIYLRKILIFPSIHYKNMYIYNIPRKKIIRTVTYIFYFTFITLWYSSFSLQNISKKTMVKVNRR